MISNLKAIHYIGVVFLFVILYNYCRGDEMRKVIKKLVLAFILGTGVTVTSIFGYASITYVLNKTVDQSVTIGETVQYTDGLFVELDTYDPYTLTYLVVEETNTTKHEVTYVYNYTVLTAIDSIEVSSLTDDIVVNNLVYTDTTISITFGLNQEHDFTNGDVVNLQFYFEAIEQSLGVYTASNPLDINTATSEELASIGFTTNEINEILTCSIPFTDIDNMNYMIYIADLIARYGEYAELGIIVFN